MALGLPGGLGLPSSGGWGKPNVPKFGMFGGRSSTPPKPPTTTWTPPNLYGRIGQNAGPGGNYTGPAQTGPIPTYQDDQLAGLKAIYGANAGQMAVAFAKNQEEADALQAKYDAANAAIGGAASQGANLANRGIDLDFEQLGVDRAALDRQTPLLDTLFGIRNDQRKSEQDYLKTLDELGNKDLANQLAGADLTQASDTRKQRSSATASGSLVSTGNRAALSDIKTAFGLTTENFKNARARDAAGIKAKWDDNYFQGEADKAKTAEDRAAIQDQYKSMDILEKRYNLSREQIANSLASTLANLNLNKIMSVGQVLQGLQSNNAQTAQMYYELLSKSLADYETLTAAGGR
jgi:hypothetical protein